MNDWPDAERIRARLRGSLPLLTEEDAQTASRCLDALDFSMRDGCLRIAFPHRFYENYYNTTACDLVTRLAKAAFGADLAINYENGLNTPHSGDFPLAPLPQGDPFEDFIISDKNRLAVAAAKSACSSQDPHLLIIIAGPSGSGKTHLLSLMQTAINRGRRAERCEKFRASSFAWKENPESYWQKPKALLLDDLQDLAANPTAQKHLCHYVDCAQAASNWSRLALAHENARFNVFIPRLARRLEAGILIELCQADLPMRLKFAENRCKLLGLPKNVALTAARHAKNIPAISGLLQKLALYVKLAGQLPPTDQIEKMAIPDGKLPDWKLILNNVAMRLGIAPADMLGAKRMRKIVLARQIAMYACRRKLGLSFPEIGRLFGGKDHSTVMHAINKIVELRKVDADINNLLTELESDGK